MPGVKAGGLKTAPKDATTELRSLVKAYGERKRDLPALAPSLINVPGGTPRQGLSYEWHSGCYAYDLDDGALEGLEVGGEERRGDGASRPGCPGRLPA